MQKILAEIGLSQREIAVFIALLKFGSTTTGPLVKESGVQNAKVYETLDKLMKKGLAQYVVKGKVKHFQASTPETLLHFFEEKRLDLLDAVQELKAIQNIQKTQHEAKIYEGIRAIRAAFYELYDHIGKNAEYYVFPIGEQLGTEELVQFWAQVFRKKQQMNITNRTLPHKRWKGIFEKHYRKYKRVKISYTNQEFPTGIFIFGEYVFHVNWGKKPVGFLMKYSENHWKRFFEEQWEKSRT